jgi:glycerol uptake facilitator-like aquaporin
MHALLVEFLGTMFLVFVVFATGNSLAIGAALSIGILLGNQVSNAIAYNPAVAISLYAAGDLSQSKLLPYIIVEILGGLAGFYFFKHIIKK